MYRTTLIFAILSMSLHVAYAEDSIAKLPPGAVPYEKEVLLAGLSPSSPMKETGYKFVEKNGVTILVGPWRQSLSTGDIVMSGFYDNDGKKTGTWKQYFPGGVLHSEMNYVADILSGQILMYTPMGKLALIGYNVNGKLEGIVVKISPNGRVASAERFKEGVVVEKLSEP